MDSADSQAHQEQWSTQERFTRSRVSNSIVCGGKDLSSDVIAKIADLTSFDKMKKDDAANYSWTPVHKAAETKFMRKGTVGGWKNYLTEEQSAEMDAICAERLKDTAVQI